MSDSPNPNPEPRQGPSFPRGLGAAVVLLLALQLVLGYIQGGLLHRQHGELQSMRADLQDLAEALEQSQGATGGTVGEDNPWTFTQRPLTHRRAPRLLKVHRLSPEGDEATDQAKKDLQQARESAQKAVQDSRKVREQLSITENARKAEEKAKAEAAQNEWKKWSLGALVLVVLAFFLRSWLRRRG